MPDPYQQPGRSQCGLEPSPAPPPVRRAPHSRRSASTMTCNQREPNSNKNRETTTAATTRSTTSAARNKAGRGAGVEAGHEGAGPDPARPKNRACSGGVEPHAVQEHADPGGRRPPAAARSKTPSADRAAVRDQLLACRPRAHVSGSAGGNRRPWWCRRRPECAPSRCTRRNRRFFWRPWGRAAAGPRCCSGRGRGSSCPLKANDPSMES